MHVSVLCSVKLHLTTASALIRSKHGLEGTWRQGQSRGVFFLADNLLPPKSLRVDPLPAAVIHHDLLPLSQSSAACTFFPRSRHSETTARLTFALQTASARSSLFVRIRPDNINCALNPSNHLHSFVAFPPQPRHHTCPGCDFSLLSFPPSIWPPPQQPIRQTWLPTGQSLRCLTAKRRLTLNLVFPPLSAHSGIP